MAIPVGYGWTSKENALKITKVETKHCDAGWRPWSYVKIETDEGITGWGEYGDGWSPSYGVPGCVRDLSKMLVGRDPRPVESLVAQMMWAGKQNPGGIWQKAIAGIDAALWDIKAKALDIPIYELLGGPTRDKIRVYWSHCGTSRVRFSKYIGKPTLKSYADVTALGKEVVAKGYTALKTNILIPGDPPAMYGEGWQGGIGGVDRNITPEVIRYTTDLMKAFREGVGDDFGLLIDLNFNFKTDGYIQMAQALEPYKLLWMEFDMYDPEAILQIKQSTRTPITTGECLYTTRGYRRYIELQCADYLMIDVPWNGLSESKKIADYCATYDINIAPHNFYSHMSTLMSAHLCASIHNVRIMESDPDDVPWKDDILTEPLQIKDGHLILPTKPGWGADINEKELAKHPWDK